MRASFALLAAIPAGIVVACSGAPSRAIIPAAVKVCPTSPGVALSGGRLLNHLPYDEAAPADLVAPPAGFGLGNCSQINREMKASLTAMIAAANADDANLGKAMTGISCFRSIERQRGLFCAPAKIAARGIIGQAKWVAPPAFSEHATGYAIDFGMRSRADCDVSQCFAQTAVGQWLAANAKKFGFELSFPNANKQGVSWEPWHYRWVGSDRARVVFARARRDFPSP